MTFPKTSLHGRSALSFRVASDNEQFGARAAADTLDRRLRGGLHNRRYHEACEDTGVLSQVPVHRGLTGLTRFSAGFTEKRWTGSSTSPSKMATLPLGASLETVAAKELASV